MTGGGEESAAAAGVGTVSTDTTAASVVPKREAATDGDGMNGVALGSKRKAWPEAVAWKCHRCSRHNAISALKCPKCLAWKGGRRIFRHESSKARASTEGCEIVYEIDGHGDGDGENYDGADMSAKQLKGPDDGGDKNTAIKNEFDIDGEGNIVGEGERADNEHIKGGGLAAKRTGDVNDDICYICYNGGCE